MKKERQMLPAPEAKMKSPPRLRSAPVDPEIEYWNAVRARDRDYDGKFYYSVATTGVYCRPSCPARLANRKNVAFHTSCADAERAGFRPCKRCKPTEPSLHERYAAKVADACRLIEDAEEPPKLDELARAIGLSTYHFHRIFKAIAGVTPKAYAVAHRQKRVRENLKRSRSVTEAIHEAGFNSSGRFYASSDDVLGMTPSDFRSGGTDAEMRFAVGECSLGSILVAASDKGIAAILFGDDPETLVHDLEDRFPKANLIGGDCAFEDVMAKVVGLVEAPEVGLALPLDVRGTAFQHRVWRALREIPVGTTATYSEIAEKIGMPKAVRAVAAACAANKIAVAIPCHRVVRNDGSLSGYRWGVERKRRLLDREAGTETDA
ncbi:bifunctional DNA-binding transcriptional regulator/O6-methylguanine-DNA methyltransferase Ada [Hyphomicrobium sp.]|uniref:bifunctional DNA-binding transcriptional regulator/O6-methylguanine-DNA methyltransferase Ada n=1 Tax=Hyphomicrobium sp. TaxID=82 RepID=UPI002D0868E9|nr:bifunctional DNA-binding transcriptional regulator/O6-methylguanine-DNA methyltransferase Ada [Hyphomicrobium sp.]HRN87292.1 bifunctional DNA-binding transcriptional regulator/O6-methylguanine-DNA methyltransferase Ada [Hyphomicrobium sp.]HRQ28190.1 bifunctional DNA-binding transcriptional regulator/O6-methylguanine-DNA methyltransferase Ada [Hyphomicrobium sp.]